MKNKAVLLAVMAASGACAPIDQPMTTGQSSAAEACFTGDQVENFRVADSSTLYVRSRQGNVYRLDAPSSCFGPGTTTIGVTPYVSVNPRICVGDQARVQVGTSSAVPLTCIARVSGPVTDSSVSGLPSRS